MKSVRVTKTSFMSKSMSSLSCERSPETRYRQTKTRSLTSSINLACCAMRTSSPIKSQKCIIFSRFACGISFLKKPTSFQAKYRIVKKANKQVLMMSGSEDYESIMAKYNSGSGVVPASTSAQSSSPRKSEKPEQKVPYGTLCLLVLNLGLFVLDHILHLRIVKGLYLYHANPRWFQFVTNAFCHANWAHLSSNIFFVYIFGKLVEEEEGVGGVWLSYLITGLGASVASYLLLPSSSGGVGLLGGALGAAQTVSLGASGAVFGLFAVSVMVKLSRGINLWKLLESFILGQFVVDRVMSEIAAQSAKAGSAMASGGINHIAHLAGALFGVALVFLVSRIPPADNSVE